MQSSLEENLVTSDSFRVIRNFEETETELRIFYENILKSLYMLPHGEFNKIRQSLRNIRSFRNRDIEVHETVDFEKKYDRCAYVFAYCIIHSLVTYDRFSDMIKDNPSMLKKIMSMKNIRLCILGGGPAFEAAAICKLLSKILAMFGPGKRPPLQVHITVIDVCADWKIEAEYIVKSIQNELCRDNNIEVDYNFIEADLTENFSPTVIKAIKKSHFVTMLKFVTDVNEMYAEKKVLGMIHKIIESMSYKSCLYFLDFSGGGVFKRIDKIIDRLPCTARIYGPCLHNCHKLKPDTVEKFPICMKDVFRQLKCTSQTTVSCSAWLKIRHIPKSVEQIVKGLEGQKYKLEKPKIKIKDVLKAGAKLNELP